MTDALRKAAQAVVDEWKHDHGSVRIVSVMMALEDVLAEQDPEPAGWLHMDHKGYEWFVHRDEKDEADTCPDCHPVYRNPPRREWQTLTDEEIDRAAGEQAATINRFDDLQLARTIERMLKERNR